MRLHLASLVVTVATSALVPGCTGATSADLTALQDISISVEAQQGIVTVGLDYAGDTHDEAACKSISATATYNGMGSKSAEVGHWQPASVESPGYCQHPYFVFGDDDVESATLEITDGSKTITVDVPHLLAARPVAFAAPAPTSISDGDTLRFTVQLAPGDVPAMQGIVEGTAAGCEGTSGYLFAGDTTQTGATASYAVRASNGCETAIPPGTPVAFDLAVSEHVETTVTTCDGATTCRARALVTTTLRSTWNP
ncbi:MAG TPA: hypothetical protein VFP84_19515 [Kofleriaceae bacterium]|nr:hypothetical protein [Kofleriaceae bacterium]